MVLEDAWALVPRARRIVVKIGSSTLTRDGQLRPDRFTRIARDVSKLMELDRQVVLVSSGAIAVGAHRLGWSHTGTSVRQKQAAAAVGQIGLVELYQRRFAKHGHHVAQILLTRSGLEDRERFLNARHTMLELLHLGVVPIVNENDTVATEEIRYGDNDRLAARVAQMISADCLLLLSDTDGLHTADPTRNPEAKLVAEVHAVTADIEAMAGEAATEFGKGGMITKVAAGRIALAAGCHMAIASGRVRHPVRAVEEGARCTWFVAAASPGSVRKQWIAGSLQPRGEITVDAGAAAALATGKSLLPAGVVRISGEFDRGDAVLVRDAEGRALAHGLAAYGAADARRIIGMKSHEIAAVLGYRGREELVHRNDLAMVMRHG